MIKVTAAKLTSIEESIRSEYGDTDEGAKAFVNATKTIDDAVFDSKLMDVVDGHIRGWLEHPTKPPSMESLRITLGSVLSVGIHVGITLAESERLEEVGK